MWPNVTVAEEKGMDGKYIVEGTRLIDREKVKLAEKKESLKRGLSSGFRCSLLGGSFDRLPQ